MLKYKEFVNNLLEDISHSGEAVDFAKLCYFPLTPKISKAYYNTRINCFHLTDVQNLSNFKTLLKSPKTISCFTSIGERYLKDFRGIRTNGGVLLELDGNLVLNSVTDIISSVDESGMRWISEKYFRDSSTEFQTKYEKFKKTANLKRGEYGGDEMSFLDWYIPYAEDFVIKNKDVIVNFLTSIEDDYWDEILVNDIIIKDVLVLSSYKDSNFLFFTKTVNKSVFGSLEKLEEFVKSISTGEIWITRDKEDAISFVTNRGGKLL
jgi:hypothetical protein